MKCLRNVVLALFTLFGLAMPGRATVYLNQTNWTTNWRQVQSLPTNSAWYGAYSTHGPLSVVNSNLLMGPVDSSSALAISYFTPSDSSPPVQLNVGDTLTATFWFMFDGIPTVGSTSQGFRFGLFDFNDGSNSPKRVSSDGFNGGSSSQGNWVEGYALFAKMYTPFYDDQPIIVSKRYAIYSSSLLGSSTAWLPLAKGGDTNMFDNFANKTNYVLQFVFQRTNLTSLAITETWSNMANGQTLTVSTADDDATNYSFDGIAYRPQNNTQAPVSNFFKQVKIEVASAPVAATIDAQPPDLSLFSGQTATFSNRANGTLPLYYWWYFNTNTLVTNSVINFPPVAHIPTANASLKITNVQTPDAGGYMLILSNAYGSVTSVVATLTVSNIAPVITAQPQDLTNIPGQTATFSVTAFGSEPLSYQWYYNTNSLLTNETASTLTLTNVQTGDAGSYSVIVSNPIGSVVSTNAVLTVDTSPHAPVFVTQPAPASVVLGASASFSAYAVGTAPISYQWTKDGGLVTNATATSTTLIVPNVQFSDAGNYALVASNSIGVTTSSNATLTVLFNPPRPVIPTNQYNILDFGAYGNGISNNIKAIQDTINAAALAGGGYVVVPTNGALNTYLTGPITLGNNVALQIKSNATLKMLPYGSWPSGPPDFIAANNLHDIAITGSGTLEGQGSTWWDKGLQESDKPNMVNFQGACTRVLIEGVTFQNGPVFHMMLKGSNVSVTVQNVTVNTPTSPNTDGIDLASTNVLIQNCHIADGDDNIEIGGSAAPAADVTVSNCWFGIGHGVSIGSQVGGGVHDLTVSNCTFVGTDNGIRLKSDRDGDGGLAQNLRYLDITMTNVGYPLVIYSYYNQSFNNVSPADAAAKPSTNSIVDATPIWRNITIRNLTATNPTGSNISGIIWGLPEMLVSNVTLSNVNFLASTKAFDIYNAQGIKIIDSNLTAPGSTNTLVLYNAEVTVTNSAGAANLVTMSGLAKPPTNNVLAFFNVQVTITDTNVLRGNSPITLGGSTLSFTQGPMNFSNDFNAVTASTLLLPGGTNTFNGALAGPGPLTLTLANNSAVRLSQGTNTWGDPNGVFDTGSSGAINNRSAGDITIFLGALSGGSGSTLRGSDQTGPGVDTYVIGGLNSNMTFAGAITDGTSATTPHTVALTKIGSGILTLSGATSYSGNTTVSNGTLLVNSTMGTGAVTVGSGATLGGNGVIGGPVTVDGTLSPGTSVGTLTVSNNLVLNSDAVLQYELGTSSDLIAVSGDLTVAGTLNVTAAGNLANTTYTLFTYGGALTFNGLNQGSMPPYHNYAIDTNTPGQVNLVLTTTLNALQQWQLAYFGATNSPAGNPSADPDGDGMLNTNEFLAGFNPTNSAAYLHVINVAKTGTDVKVTYLGANGDSSYEAGPVSRTNVLEVSPGRANGSYSNNFVSAGVTNILSGGNGLGIATNMVDSGGATNVPSRYYRVRVLVP